VPTLALLASLAVGAPAAASDPSVWPGERAHPQITRCLEGVRSQLQIGVAGTDAPLLGHRPRFRFRDFDVFEATAVRRVMVPRAQARDRTLIVGFLDVEGHTLVRFDKTLSEQVRTDDFSNRPAVRPPHGTEETAPYFWFPRLRAWSEFSGIDPRAGQQRGWIPFVCRYLGPDSRTPTDVHSAALDADRIRLTAGLALAEDPEAFFGGTEWRGRVRARLKQAARSDQGAASSP
jgi:hypothetical protein